MNSLELVRRLYQSGTLRKEAALDVLRAREHFIKQALKAEAEAYWQDVLGTTKEAGLFDRLRRGGGAVANSGLFNRLRHGALTPAKEPSATWSDVGSNLLKMMGVAGLSAGATAGIGALVKHKHDRALAGDIERSYETMFDEFPRLKEVREKDPELVRTHFGVLAKFAPSLAADPTVAGSFVQSTTVQGIIEPKTIHSLAETQRRIDEMREGRSPFSEHFDRGIGLAHRAMNPHGGSKPT